MRQVDLRGCVKIGTSSIMKTVEKAMENHEALSLVLNDKMRCLYISCGDADNMPLSIPLENEGGIIDFIFVMLNYIATGRAELIHVCGCFKNVDYMPYLVRFLVNDLKGTILWVKKNTYIVYWEKGFGKLHFNCYDSIAKDMIGEFEDIAEAA